MAQALPRYCPRCGTPTRADMQFCATCKLPVGAMLHRPDSTAFSIEDANTAPQEATMPTPRRIPPGNDAYFSSTSPGSQDFQAGQNTAEESTRSPQFPPTPPRPAGAGGWSTSAQEPWNASGPASLPGNQTTQAQWNNQAAPLLPLQQTFRQRSQRAGRIYLTLLIGSLIVVIGALVFAVLGGYLPGMKPSQATIKTTNLNSNVTYAGATVTILNVQQAQDFLDDPQTATDGMLRLNLQEQNTTKVPIAWDYNQSARLASPGKAALAPTYVKAKGSIAPGATQKSFLDFTIKDGGNLNSLLFQLGTAREAQLQIPLSGQADLNKYQPQTSKQNKNLVYFGLNWTLTGTTRSLSLPNQQASSGMEFLVLNLTIDNTLSQQAISGSPFDYLRVKAGGKTVAPIGSTVPVSFATGEMGKTGTATFLIPQNSAACTLLMLSQDPGTSGQASVNFQI